MTRSPETPAGRQLVVGMVGLGYWGPNVARNLAHHPRIRMKWLCDLDRRRLERLAPLYPAAQLSTRVETLLEDPEVEALAIAVPGSRHYHLARQALEAGRHVLVEKPLALTSGEAVDLVHLAEHRERVLMVGHTFLYNAAVRYVKERLDAGDLGEPYYVATQRVNLGRLHEDMNAFWSIAPHDVSIVNWWFGGMPREVQATGAACLSPGVEDVVFATLYYEGGRIAHIHASWLDPAKERKITVVGSRRMLVYDDVDAEARIRVYDQGVERRVPDRFFGDYQTRLRAGDITIPRIEYPEPLAVEVGAFAAAVLDGARPVSDGVNGLEVVLVCEAVAESLKHGGIRIAIPPMAKVLAAEPDDVVAPHPAERKAAS